MSDLKQYESLDQAIDEKYAQSIAQNIRQARNKLRNDVWVAVKTTIMKTLEYPMAATTICKEEWDKIMWHLLKVCLPCSGFARTFPHCVLYGPTDYGGLGIMHPWYNQELTHLEVLWEEISRESHTGQLLQASLEELYLELDFVCNLTSIPYQDMHLCATPSWMTSLWETCNKFDIQFETDLPLLPLKRDSDSYIMQEFVRLGNYTPQELKLLNECRMNLHATTIADLTTACGSFLLSDAYDAKLCSQGSNSYHWPRVIPTLTTQHRNLWKQALEHCYLDPGSHRHAL
jgi:hypothetical protein